MRASHSHRSRPKLPLLRIAEAPLFAVLRHLLLTLHGLAHPPNGFDVLHLASPVTNVAVTETKLEVAKIVGCHFGRLRSLSAWVGAGY